MVSIEECGTHQLNLAQKHVARMTSPLSSLKRVLDFQEAFTAFVEKSSKAKLVLTQSAKALQIKKHLECVSHPLSLLIPVAPGYD